MTLIFLDSMDNQLLINSNSAVTLDRNYCMHFGDVSAIANYASAVVTQCYCCQVLTMLTAQLSIHLPTSQVGNDYHHTFQSTFARIFNLLDDSYKPSRMLVIRAKQVTYHDYCCTGNLHRGKFFFIFNFLHFRLFKF